MIGVFLMVLFICIVFCGFAHLVVMLLDKGRTTLAILVMCVAASALAVPMFAGDLKCGIWTCEAKS